MTTARKKIVRGRPVGSSSIDPNVAVAFGRAVVGMRTTAGISQEALALEASIGRTNMSAIENGRNSPSLQSMVRIASALGCGLPALMREFERALAALEKDEASSD